MKKLRAVAVTFLALWLSVGLLNIRLHAFQNSPFNFVSVAGTLRLIWNYPFEVAQAIRFNNVRFVGLGYFAGSDVIAEMQTAYNDLPTTGGTIWIVQQNDGSAFAATSTASFTTLGKPVSVRSLAPGTLGNVAKTAQTGTVINFTPVTGTAFVVDWGSVGGDTSYAGSGGFYNVQLINNQCVTNGGCASAAVGIAVGVTNGGARGLVFEDTSIMGFGKGIRFASGDSSGVGWGMNFSRGSIAFNTVGVSYEKSNAENDNYWATKFVSNGTAINVTSGGRAEFTDYGGSLDSSTVCGFAQAGGGLGLNVNLFGTHLENLGLANWQYICDAANASHLQMYGGQILDDTSGGSNSQNALTASQVEINGTYIFGGVGGRTYSGKVVNCLDTCYVNVWNGSPAAFANGTICALGTPCYLSNINHNGGQVVFPNMTATALQVNPLWPLLSGTAPTFNTGFGTGPTITQVNGVASFAVNIGTTPGTTGTLNMPTAGDGWNCFANDVTSPTTAGGYYVKQTGGTTTTVSFTFFNAAGTATAPTAADKIQINCTAY